MKILRTDTEQRLLRLFDKGEASAMDQLYACYADYLMGVCYRYVGADDAKDVLQEAFIKIVTNIGWFKYKGRGSLKAWLTRLTINEALMALRQKARQPETSLDDEPPDDMPDEPPETEGMDAATIMDMVAQLPPGYRVVFNLFAIKGLSHKEIATQLSITPSTSASQFHKARTMLARMIKNHKQNDEK